MRASKSVILPLLLNWNTQRSLCKPTHAAKSNKAFLHRFPSPTFSAACATCSTRCSGGPSRPTWFPACRKIRPTLDLIFPTLLSEAWCTKRCSALFNCVAREECWWCKLASTIRSRWWERSRCRILRRCQFQSAPLLCRKHLIILSAFWTTTVLLHTAKYTCFLCCFPP